MCSRYTYTKDEAKLRLRDKILVFGAVPRANIRPTDIGPVIVPEYEGFACREMRWGWSVPWDKRPFINAKSETVTTLKTFQPHLDNPRRLADAGVRFVRRWELCRPFFRPRIPDKRLSQNRSR